MGNNHMAMCSIFLTTFLLLLPKCERWGNVIFFLSVSVNTSRGVYPISGLGRGNPISGMGGNPYQVRGKWGTPPLHRPEMGYPICRHGMGSPLPRHDMRYPHTQMRDGVPPYLNLGWGTPLNEMGYPSPIAQISIVSTCYVAGSVPLGFKQEDFLVYIFQCGQKMNIFLLP